MSSGLTVFPKGMKYEECERGQLRIKPPIRFAPSLVSSDSDHETKGSTTKVKLTKVTSVERTQFRGGDFEAFLRHQRYFRSVLRKQGLQASYKKLVAELESEESDDSEEEEDGSDSESGKSTKSEKKREKEAAARDILTEAFNLYENLLDEQIRDDWSRIVSQYCHSAPYLDSDGNKVEEARGLSFEHLATCMRLHLLTECTKDAAEAQAHYLRVNVRKPPRISMKLFCKRLEELNGYMEDLPCLADLAEAPASTPRANKKFSDYELCSMLLQMVDKDVEAQYFANNPNQVPTNFHDIRDALERIEHALRIKDNNRSREKTASRESIGDDHGGSGKDRKRKADSGSSSSNNRIPRKQRSEGPNHKQQESGTKFCNLCQQFGGSHKTHNTRDCRRWNKDGSSKEGFGGPKTKKFGKTANAHTQELSVFMSTLEKQGKLLKKLDKKVSRKRKRRRADSDSDDSDSD